MFKKKKLRLIKNCEGGKWKEIRTFQHYIMQILV